MRSTTMVWLAARQIGVPDSESIQRGELKPMILEMIKYLAENPLRGSRFEFMISTNRDNVLKNQKADFDANGSIAKIMEGFDFENAKPEPDSA